MYDTGSECKGGDSEHLSGSDHNRDQLDLPGQQRGSIFYGDRDDWLYLGSIPGRNDHRWPGHECVDINLEHLRHAECDG